MGSSGSFTQPVMPASAIDAPITLRKPRRETESTHSDAPLGNSRCKASWNAGLPASSSRLRQYSGPDFSAASCATAASICSRTESRSSLPFLPGQTSSGFAILLCSSILSLLRGLTSSMTGTATGNVPHAAHVVLLHQRQPQLFLIDVTLPIHHHRIRARGLLVAHIEHLIPRPQIVLGRAMATQTPLHLQRLLLIHQRHPVNRTVAGVAPHALRDMNAVIEEYEVRKLVDPRPLQRFTRAVAGANGLE